MTVIRTLKNKWNETLLNGIYFDLFFAQSTKCGCSINKLHFIPICSLEWADWLKWSCWRAWAAPAILRMEKKLKKSLICLVSLEWTMAAGVWWIGGFSWLVSDWWVMGAAAPMAPPKRANQAKKRSQSIQIKQNNSKRTKGRQLNLSGSWLKNEINGAHSIGWVKWGPNQRAVSEINQFHFSSPAARDEEMELNDWRDWFALNERMITGGCKPEWPEANY